LDISAEVPTEILQKYGLLPNNAILADESKHLPLYAELIADHPIQYIAGGSGQNTMRATQWLLRDHPNSTVFIGSVGKDENGQRLKSVATEEGVKVLYHEDPEAATGICAVLITGRNRSMVANLAAANNYKKEHFDSELVQQAVQKAKMFYGTGYFLTVSSETLVSLGQYAAKSNKPFLTSLSAPFIIEFFWERLASILPYSDVVFGNETEYGALGKALHWGTDLKEIAKKLSEYPKENKLRQRTVVITQGPLPTIVVHEGQLLEFPTLKVDNIVDTNGAGDSFVGGFLAAYVQDKPLAECVSAGHFCASVTLQTSGTSFKGKQSTFQFSK
jgi:adenosine kinase